jgi:hypothetical protein
MRKRRQESKNEWKRSAISAVSPLNTARYTHPSSRAKDGVHGRVIASARFFLAFANFLIAVVSSFSRARNSPSDRASGRNASGPPKLQCRSCVFPCFDKFFCKQRHRFSHSVWTLIILAMADALPSESIVATIEEVAAKFELCRNRVWEIASSLDAKKRNKLLQIPSSIQVEKAGRHEDHDQCTFDFCEHSRLDFTGVQQRHECPKEQCGQRFFNTNILEDALEKGKLTAWALDGTAMVARPKTFMAISHVWSDGTGSGAWPPGQVNTCLYEFFMKIAEKFQCDGIWWDTICIPKGKVMQSQKV